MKKYIILLTIALVSAMPAWAQTDRNQRPEAGPARAPEIGQYESFTLKNGLKVFVVENRKLPRVSFSLIVDRDPVAEGNKAGYVSMTGDLLGRGTTKRNKETFDREVDFMGASLNTSATSVSASGLSKYAEKLVELMADVVLNPAFSQEEFDKAKEQTLSGLKAAKDEPGSIMSNVYNSLIFGKNHPYGEIVSEETVNNFTLEDCKSYHATYFKPNITYLAIVGDINVKQAKKLVEKYFGKWAAGTVPANTFELPKDVAQNMVAFVDRQASVQSVIRIGNPIVLKPGDADIEAMRIMNQILGSGSMGRLYNNLREDKGYTYGAYSTFGTDELVSSMYSFAQVRNEVTSDAIKEFLFELNRIGSGDYTDEEMQKAKASISGSFGRSLESPSTIAGFALNTALYNLPADYYQNYLKRIDAVTKEDVQRVAKKYIKTNNLRIIVVGKGQQVAPDLEQFGAVSYFDADANPTAAPSFLIMPEGVTAADVVNKYLKAIGGLENIKKITAYSQESELNIQGFPSAIELTEAKIVPGYYMQFQNVPGMFSQKVLYVNGKGTKSGMQSGDVAGEELEELKRNASVLMEELNYLSAEYKIVLEGQNKLNGKDVYQLLVTGPDGSESREYFDVTTGLRTRTEKSEDTPQGPILVVTDYLEYKPFGGVMFPTSIDQNVGNMQRISNTVKTVKINKEVSKDLFK